MEKSHSKLTLCKRYNQNVRIAKGYLAITGCQFVFCAAKL